MPEAGSSIAKNCMNVRSFIDTNVLVYTDDRSAPAKQAIALDLLQQGRSEGKGVLSTQVLQEYFSAATRKLAVPVETARRKVELFSRFQVVPVDVDLIIGGIDLHRLHGFSFWDALIIRAALVSRCAVLYTEDLQAGQRVEGLRIVNPFLP